MPKFLLVCCEDDMRQMEGLGNLRADVLVESYA